MSESEESGSNVVEIRKLAKQEYSELFLNLRSITDVQERRAMTQSVYDMKMRIMRKKTAYRGDAKHLVEDVHPMFRKGFDKVLKSSSEGNVKIAKFNEINRILHNHHGGEDDHWFPKLKREFPEMSTELNILESEHTELVKLEKDIKNGSYVALVEFVAALNDHLNREELLTVPCLMSGSTF
jgi:hypothetical protein